MKHHHCFLVQHVSHSHEASPGQEPAPAPEPAAANQLALKSCSGFLPVLGYSAWCSLCQNHPSCLSVFLITVISSVSGVFSLFLVSLKEQVTCPCSCFKSVSWAWSSKGFLFAFFVFYFLASIWPVEFSGNLVGHVVIVLAVEEWINKIRCLFTQRGPPDMGDEAVGWDDNAHEQTKKLQPWKDFQW